MEQEVVGEICRAFPFESERLLVDDQVDGIEARPGGGADLVGQVGVLREEHDGTHLQALERLTLDTDLVVCRSDVAAGDEAGGVAEQAERACRELAGLVAALDAAVEIQAIVEGQVG